MKKFKIYSTMLLVALISIVVFNMCSISFPTYYADADAKLELAPMPQEFYTQDSIGNGLRTKYGPNISYDIYVNHNSSTYPASAMISQVSANLDKHSVVRQDCLVEMQKVNLSIPYEKIPNKAYVMGFVAGQVSFVVVLSIFVLVFVFKVIRMIRKGEIFVSKVARYLEWSGWLLSIYYLFGLIGSFATYLNLRQCIHLKDYAMVFHNETSYWVLLVGLILMVLSQIIQMGKEMKEEQDLTI